MASARRKPPVSDVMAPVRQAAAVRYLPPWRIRDREAWALAHPGIAGVYFGILASGLIMTPVFFSAAGVMAHLGVLAGAAGLAVVSGWLFARSMASFGRRYQRRDDE